MKLIAKYLLVALSFVGSAISLYSCEQKPETDTSGADEVRMTEYSEHLSLVMSQNGRRSYHFIAPLVEGYTLAREPYREFRKGVKITTYNNDSLSSVDAVLTANYAIYYENRQLWEAKGNVVVEKSDGKTLYTQQLFWNARTKKIYSNVDSKIVQSGGRDVFIGEGFESDEEFKEWRFRRMKGRMEVNVAPTDNADSVAASGTPPAASGKVSSARTTSERASSRNTTSGNTSAENATPGSVAAGAVSAAGAAASPKSGSRPASQDRQSKAAPDGHVEPLSMHPDELKRYDETFTQPHLR